MIIRAFNITMATDSMPNSVSQAMHLDVENNAKDAFLSSCRKSLAIWKRRKKKRERRKKWPHGGYNKINIMKMHTFCCIKKKCFTKICILRHLFGSNTNFYTKKIIISDYGTSSFLKFDYHPLHTG